MDEETEPHPKTRARIVPWVEKYRPERVDDVAHQDEVVRTLKASIATGSLPHLLFYGPPGTGKTTTILAVARALYGPDYFRIRTMELNASDERGIAVVREKIKTFAQGAVGGQKSSGYPCPRFKLIVLDECDSMTPEAQAALRRIMETYSRVTRFCLICNYVTRVIEPLASRCAKFRFKPLPVESMLARISQIAEAEHVSLSADTMHTILSVAGGDMRKAVTFLQSSHQLSAGGPVTTELVLDIAGKMPPSVVQRLWAAMRDTTFDVLQTAVSDVIAEGYPMNALLAQLHDDVVIMIDIKDIDKALICEKIAQVEQCLLDGSSEPLQLMDLMAFIMRRFNQSPSNADLTNAFH